MSTSAVLGVNTSKHKCSVVLGGFLAALCFLVLLGKMHCFGWKGSVEVEPHLYHWALSFFIVLLLI